MSSFKLIIISIILIRQIAFGLITTISLEKGYCSGEFWKDILSSHSSNKDTIKFSSGLLLNILPISCGDLEMGYLWINLLFNDKSFNKIGYSIIDKSFQKINFCSYQQSIGIFDTNWNAALKFPDSLGLLDSIQTDTQSISIGKWCFNNFSDPIDGCYGYKLNNSYNSIIYIRCFDNRNIKLQFYNYKTLLIKSQALNYPYCPGDQFAISSINIRWAADSMGNGIFKEEAVKNIKSELIKGSNIFNIPTIRASKDHIEFHFTSGQSPVKAFQIFNVTGTKIFQRHDPDQRIIWDTHAVSAGVYLAKVTYANKQQASARFIVKK